MGTVADDFIESWGTMGMLWGVNRSIARIHALLIVADAPMSLERIAERLSISKGNASMSLKELKAWKVIRQVSVPGDRRDFYETEPDAWQMFFQIMSERKRREFDPALGAVRRALEQDAGLPEQSPVRRRLEQMEDLLATMESVMTRFLSNPKTSKAMLHFLSGNVLEGIR